MTSGPRGFILLLQVALYWLPQSSSYYYQSPIGARMSYKRINYYSKSLKGSFRSTQMNLENSRALVEFPIMVRRSPAPVDSKPPGRIDRIRRIPLQIKSYHYSVINSALKKMIGQDWTNWIMPRFADSISHYMVMTYIAVAKRWHSMTLIQFILRA